MPHWHVTLPAQITDHRFSAVLTQFVVHYGSAGGVGIADPPDDVPLEAGSGLRHLAELYLLVRRYLRTTDCEFHDCRVLYVIFTQRGKSIGVLLDVLHVLFNLLCVRRDVLLV